MIYFKDGPIVEDGALGINPNSVYCVRSVHLNMALLAAVLVLNSNNQH